MLIFRVVFLLLLLAVVLCVAMYVATGNILWRRRAVAIFRWAVIAGLCLFGLLILSRLLPRVF
ncbi:MAG: hypothetical protein EPO01_06090 [Aquabacterium sp.]|nr:MAG: hypothetical protein EPO01_06090 [Aquabacterium sp.]